MQKVKRYLLALALLASSESLLMGALTSKTQSSEDPVRLITFALRNGDYAGALKLAQTGLKTAPKDARLLTLEGVAFSCLERANEALGAFHSALKIDPDYVPALEGLAEIEYKAGKPDPVPVLDRLLKLKPDEQTAHAMRAVMAWKQKDCATAVRHFEQSRQVIASQPDALKEYGICLIRLQRPEDAVLIWRQITARDPADKTAVFSLASSQLIAKQWNDALQTLTPLTESEQPDARALELASTALEEKGDTPGAVAALRRAILQNPSEPDFYVDFAQLALVHQSFQVGIDVVNAGLKRLPNAAQLYIARGVLKAQLAQYGDADADFSKADQLDAQMTLGATARGLAAAEQSDLEKALFTVRQELKTRPSDPYLYYVFAEILNSRGAQPGSPEFKEALSAASKAVELKPDFVLARDTLSRLYLEAGETTKAIEQCRLALRSDPMEATAIYRLIRALQSSGHEEHRGEIASLLKRFTEVREQIRKKEAQQARFRLVEADAPGQTSESGH